MDCIGREGSSMEGTSKLNPGWTMCLAFLNLMLQHLPCTNTLDMLPSNSPQLGLLPHCWPPPPSPAGILLLGPTIQIQISQSSVHPSPSIGCSYTWLLYPFPNHQEPVPDNSGQCLCFTEPMKLLRPADLKPFTLPPHLFLPSETPLKAPVHSPLPSLCFLTDPGASLYRTA